MSARVFRIPVEGEVVEAQMNDEVELSEWVGGWLEALTGRDYIMWMDEEGLRKQLPRNGRASCIAQRDIVGDVVITGLADRQGNITSVPDRVASTIQSWLMRLATA